MEFKIEDGDFIDHTSKCRVCLSPFAGAEDRFEITADLKLMFKNVSQMEVNDRFYWKVSNKTPSVLAPRLQRIFQRHLQCL